MLSKHSSHYGDKLCPPLSPSLSVYQQISMSRPFPSRTISVGLHCLDFRVDKVFEDHLTSLAQYLSFSYLNFPSTKTTESLG